MRAKRVRDLARSLGLLAKTDRLDARVLARFGEFLGPAPTRLPSRAGAPLQPFGRHGLAAQALSFVVDDVAYPPPFLS